MQIPNIISYYMIFFFMRIDQANVELGREGRRRGLGERGRRRGGGYSIAALPLPQCLGEGQRKRPLDTVTIRASTTRERGGGRVGERERATLVPFTSCLRQIIVGGEK